MPQRSSTLSYHASAAKLHPVLQAALDSLDVEIEEELVRYRRQRYRQAKHVEPQQIPIWQPPIAGVQASASPRSPQLPFSSGTSVQNVLHRLQQNSATPNLNQVANPIAGSDRLASLASDELVNELASDGQPVFEQSHPFRAERNAREPIATPPEEVLKEFGGALPSTCPAMPPQPPDHQRDLGLDVDLTDMTLTTVSPDPDWEELLREGVDSGSIDAAPDSESALEANPLPFDTEPEDYLESSEDLLRSIAEESVARRSRQEANLLNSLLSPLGVGSMALVLLSSASLGYVIMHPSSLDFLWSSQQASHSNGAGTDAETFASPLIPDSPNLAADEFVDLNVNNLSTIPGTPARSPLPSPPATTAATPAPTPAAIDTAPIETAPVTETVPAEAEPASPATPDPLPVVEPEPVYVTPEPPITESTAPSEPIAVSPPEPLPPESAEVATAPLPPEPIASESSPVAATQPAGTYYVVSPYNGDPSLQQAREAVPDAYVRNFASGASVQLGVFSDQENAQELLQQLEAEGIPAEIYQP
jgi:hypothetical protein